MNNKTETARERANSVDRISDNVPRQVNLQIMSLKGNDQHKILVKSGHCQTNTGYRAFVMSTTGQIRPVRRVHRSGYIPDRATFQLCSPTDFIFHAERLKKNASATMTVFFFDDEMGVCEYTNYAKLQHLWSMVPPEISKWLEDFHDRTESFLPAGFGWDGVQSDEEKRKEERLRTFLRGLRGEQIIDIITPAMKSPGKDLPTSWRRANPRMPSHLDAPAKTHLDVSSNIKTYTQWILIFSDGRVSLRTPEPTSGKELIHGNEPREYAGTLRPMPEKVIRAVKVTRGAYERNGKTFGIKWELFSK